ncbi:cation:proton antiporter [Legionella saoudiensis]|uniref:cation:proton antiporter n=1 Tax=Legionella saoudiensis TaxID=1750561 RepID=UPI0007313E00|nr:cation:proton antiporter [Legionella saoudiensis]
MANYDIIFFLLGLAFLASAWLPQKLIHMPLSLSMIWLGIGILICAINTNFPYVSPLKNSVLTEYLTELAILISLLGAGLKIDRKIGLHSWKDTWLLLGIAMPLCIVTMTLAAMCFINLPFPIALLLAALIAPTDPVLASDVQVGPPGEGGEHDVRFALTSEAGLNDGLAFPFVTLALIFISSAASEKSLAMWFGVDFLWRIAVGIFMGFLIGHYTAKLLLKPPKQMAIRDDFTAIALVFLAYGATQLAYGNGFLGAFIASHTFRHYKRDHHFHNILYNFSEQVERLIIPVLLLLMAIFIYQGIFIDLSWKEVLLSFFFLLFIRPVCALISLSKSKTSTPNKIIISIFGIRGVGSFYYLSYALNRIGNFNYGQQLWRITLLIVLISIIVHGMSGAIIFNNLPKSRRNK